MKFLLVVVVVVAVLWLMLGRKRGAAPQPPGHQDKRPQALLACAQCGLQFPAADAVLDGSRVYCCEAHRAKGPAQLAPPRDSP